jgi:hypothetical protein
LAFDAAVLARQAQPDGMLDSLLRLADTGVGASVGLMLNGMVVVGQLASPREAAKETDEFRRFVIDQFERPADQTEEEWAETRERFGRAAAEAVERFLSGRAGVLEEGDAFLGAEGLDVDNAPPDLARRIAFYETRTSLTLTDVKVVSPAHPGVMHLPLLRVQLAQLAAWWPVRLDDSGSAQIRFFTAED